MSVGGVAVHVEIHIALFRGISMPLFDEFCDEIYDISDIFRRFQPDVGVVYAEFSHRLVDVLYHLGRIFARGNSRLFRFCDDFVVHVRIVSGIGDFIPLFFQKFAHDVVNERLISVPDMRFARHRNAARVHLYLSLFQRDEFFFSFRKRIVNFHIIFLVRFLFLFHNDLSHGYAVL